MQGVVPAHDSDAAMLGRVPARREDDVDACPAVAVEHVRLHRDVIGRADDDAGPDVFLPVVVLPEDVVP
jgi:hypothetical protein